MGAGVGFRLLIALAFVAVLWVVILGWALA